MKNLTGYQKVLIAGGSLVLCSMMILGIASYIFLRGEVVKISETVLTEKTEEMIYPLEVSYNFALELEKEFSLHLNDLIRNRLTVHESLSHQVSIENQTNGSTQLITIPHLLLDGKELWGRFNEVDSFTKGRDSAATFFQIIDEGMVRISTTVKKTNGERAIGTYIPKDSPVYSALIKGENFQGLATVLGKKYLSSYIPIKNDQGKVIAAFFTGLPIETLFKHFIEKLKSDKVFGVGEYYLIDGEGQGIIHPQHENENLISISDDHGDFIYKTMVEQKKGTIYYSVHGVNHVGKFVTYDKMNWTIVNNIELPDLEIFWGGIKTKLIILVLFLTLMGVFFFWFIINRTIKKSNMVLFSQTKKMEEEIFRGNLKFRIDEDRISLEFRPLIKSVNEILSNAIGPINKASSILMLMANGNLTKYISEQYKGDFSLLKESLNRTLASFNKGLHKVHDVVIEINKGSQQVASTGHSLSQGATESASSLEEISSTINEISSQTKKNAENAKIAQNIGAQTKMSAEQGNSHMKEMLEAMKEINSSSENISKIIKVIDEIAFQTNLLALNAAVEAARAGRHGKGFAVVAEEVRNLARKSAEAASETTNLIETSGKKVGAGSLMAEKTAKALEEINNNTVKMSDLINEISFSSEEQSQGISQVVTALGQINLVTQQNTASAEESASAANDLANQISLLKELLGEYQLGDSSLLQSSSNDQYEEVVRWDESYSVQVVKMDDEHKVLFKLINDFYNGLKKSTSKDLLLPLVKGLKDYTIMHFSHEEDMMAQYSYPGIDGQKKAHKAFVAKIDEYEDLVNRGDVIMPMEMLQFLNDWLVQHIQKMDMRYTEFFEKKKLLGKI